MTCGAEGSESSVAFNSTLPFLNCWISLMPSNISAPISRLLMIDCLCNLFQNMTRNRRPLRFAINRKHPDFMIRLLPIVDNSNTTAFSLSVSSPANLPDASRTFYDIACVRSLHKIRLQGPIIFIGKIIWKQLCESTGFNEYHAAHHTALPYFCKRQRYRTLRPVTGTLGHPLPWLANCHEKHFRGDALSIRCGHRLAGASVLLHILILNAHKH